MHNSKILTKQIFTIISFITGIIGFSLLIISFFLPWYLVQLGNVNGGLGPRYVFYSYWANNNSFYSLLFGSIFGLLMTIILILSWKRKKSQIFSSLILLGILTSSVIIEYTISIIHGPSYGFLAIFYVLYEYPLIGYFLNLIAVIIIIFMIGISLLGFFLFERTQNKSRKQEIDKNHSLSIFSLLLLTVIIVPFFLYKANSIYYYIISDTEICLMLGTIGMLSFTIRDPKNHYKSLIPSFLITFFTLIIVRLCIDLNNIYHIELIITHLFYFEIIFILLIFSYISFEEIPRSSKMLILDYKKKRSRMFYLIKILYGITIIVLIYTVINWVLYGFEGGYPIMNITPQGILIYLLIFYATTLIFILSSLIHSYKEGKHDLIQEALPLNIKIKKKKNLRKINSHLLVIILLFTIFTYLILCLSGIIPEDMKVLIINRNISPEIVVFFPEIFIIFIILNLFPLFIFIGLQVLRSVRFKKRKKEKYIL